ncbi:hypothetical protein BX600DRAFT_437122 [Xylariales sp. PMI_506]|nr:hypothetical protein BX600DRAFT_437122 [Xylariales sp. PMI_506]
MQFKIATVLGLAALATAAPQIQGAPAIQAGDSCGNNLAMSCCTDSDTTGVAVNAAVGLLAGLLDDLEEGLGLFTGCSKILGLGGECKQTPVCCQHPDTVDGNAGSLINLAIPCVNIGSILKNKK